MAVREKRFLELKLLFIGFLPNTITSSNKATGRALFAAINHLYPTGFIFALETERTVQLDSAANR